MATSVRQMAVLVLGLVVLSSGCATRTGEQSIDQSPPALDNVEKLTNSQDIALPLDFYRATKEQRAVIATAKDLATRDCLRRFGFDWKVVEHTGAQPPSRRYGIGDLTEVSKYGYHLPPDYPVRNEQPKEIESESARKTDKTAINIVLNGHETFVPNSNEKVPEGGCHGEARRSLGVTDSAEGTGQFDSVELAPVLDSEAAHLTEKDPRLLDAFGRWSECMNRAGYHYHDPWEANDDRAWGGETASAREISTAVADLRCRQEHNVAGLYFAIETAYQNRLIDRHAELLRQQKAQLEERIRVAHKVVANTR
ncbi:hypothetical protein SAMN05216266_11114 [Amycolatopsis marina]|uniref:Secreted protein n=1 Tax=Amycolatopsis marina TaxID=490629 RepID=A0A1I1AXG8_9PSEU|nr:hypothetical protein [Amycolatopsis marina]SFB42741.1 hypothetical protein SAMN05216266_11114 [Amycolatopsis marina]